MKTIAIDLTPLQGPHRMRGVGATLINFINNLPSDSKGKYHFLFFVNKEGVDEALEPLKLKDLSYETKIVNSKHRIYPSVKSLKGLLYTPLRVRDIMQMKKRNNQRLGDISDLKIDAYLQFEQDKSLPAGSFPATVIAYDLIPYIMESDYLWNYRTAREIHNYSRRGALLKQAKRWLYLYTIQCVMNSADKIIAISNQTREDFINIAKVPEAKISVTHLGVEPVIPSDKAPAPNNLSIYKTTVWGEIEKKVTLPDEPFLLFIGGVDPRRKLKDLIAAYNQLRAQGHSIKLVLAGDTLYGASSIPNDEIRNYAVTSSYLDDIYFLGYIDDTTRDWLYKHALAFVYPSKYEGFGLPVLEAMRFGTPVITYQNSSIQEIASNAAMYASNGTEIAAHAIGLLGDPALVGERRNRGLSHVKSFAWSSTSRAILDTATKDLVK